MNKFEFHGVGRIVFGRGQFARMGELAARLGRSALVVSNAGRQGDGGMVDRLAGLLSAAGVRMAFLGQAAEPQVADVERGLRAAREEKCDMVIGLGGGSAIDAAKAVAALLTNGGSPTDYMEVVGKGLKITRPAAAWIAVPTTAGTGAEVTRNAVIGWAEKRFKASIRSEHLLARFVLVDAELGVSVPRDVTAWAGMDAMCQLIESYTSLGATPITDALAMRGIALAARSLRRAFVNGGDLDAREEMALAALLSGMALANAGLGAAHGLAAPLGANFPVPHGAACAALLRGVLAANVAALRAWPGGEAALGRYAAIGRTLTGRTDLRDSEAIDAATEFTAALARDLDIPALGRFGLTEGCVREMVDLAGRSSSMRYNPVSLSPDALAEVLREAL